MNRVSYDALQANYPRKPEISGDALYESIGHPEYAHNAYMENTCAVRVSMALVGAGVRIAPGHMNIKAGKFKGKRLEQGQARLSELLARIWGVPERMPTRLESRSVRAAALSAFSSYSGQPTRKATSTWSRQRNGPRFNVPEAAIGRPSRSGFGR